jgi:hypothetical protein
MGFFFTGDRGFESTSLHGRVSCEPDFLDQGAENFELRGWTGRSHMRNSFEGVAPCGRAAGFRFDSAPERCHRTGSRTPAFRAGVPGCVSPTVRKNSEFETVSALDDQLRTSGNSTREVAFVRPTSYVEGVSAINFMVRYRVFFRRYFAG